MRPSPRPRRALLPALAVALLLADLVIAYQLPQVHDRFSWRVEVFVAQVEQFLFPRPQTISTPNPQVAARALETLTAIALATPTSTPTPLPSPEAELPTPTSTATPLPLPPAVKLKAPRHEWQLFNNCGPATLSMTLRYWGWQGSQIDTAAVVKPVQDDRNVMPYEMARYVQDHTDLDAVVRAGGSLEVLKRLLAAGFPPIIEKGFNVVEKSLGWMGHYNLLTAYDDTKREFLAQDSFRGPDYAVDYDTLVTGWRAFNFTYLVVFPPERRAEVMAALGPSADESFNQAFAIQEARAETELLRGQDLAFAWFNLGTSLVSVYDYGPAALAFDNARYAGLPWRMLWYQTGPYFAYFYTGRYQDVIDLANETLDRQDNLEESWYWRGMAKAALGDRPGAIGDLETALAKHPGFPPALAQLQQLGAAP